MFEKNRLFMICAKNMIMDIERARQMSVQEERQFRGDIVFMLNELLIECEQKEDSRGFKDRAIKIILAAESFVAFSKVDYKCDHYKESAKKMFLINRSVVERITFSIFVLNATSDL